LKLKELLFHLDDFDDPEMEVQIRIWISPETEEDELPLSDFIGEYCQITGEKDILVEYGKLTIVADWTPE